MKTFNGSRGNTGQLFRAEAAGQPSEAEDICSGPGVRRSIHLGRGQETGEILRSVLVHLALNLGEIVGDKDREDILGDQSLPLLGGHATQQLSK